MFGHFEIILSVTATERRKTRRTINEKFEEKDRRSRIRYSLVRDMPFDSHSRSTTGVQRTSALRGFHSDRH